MTGPADVLKKLLDRYRISEPLSPEEQRMALEGRKRVLMKVLQKSGEDRFLTGLSVSLNIFFRGLGVRFRHASRPRVVAGASFAAASLLLISGFLLFSQGPFRKDGDGSLFRALMAEGEVRIFRQGTAPVRAAAGGTIQAGDEVDTGSGSHLLIRSGTGDIIYLAPGSNLRILGDAPGSRDFMLTKGQAISRVKIRPGAPFRVTTPNARAEALGTEFSVSFRDGISVITLGAGRLMITRTLSDERRFLEAGYTAVVAGSLDVRPLSGIEILELKKLPGGTENGGKKGGFSWTREKEGEYLRRIGEIDRQIDEIRKGDMDRFRLRGNEKEDRLKIPPLDRLRKEGKVLTMLHMKDGSRIAGSIVSQDEGAIRLDTADGIISIPKREIVRRSPMD